MKWLGIVSLAMIVAATFALHPARSQSDEEKSSSRRAIPDRFTPLDTSRLMGSPDPMPLEAVKAFPNLKFQRPVELAYAEDGSNRLFVVEQQGVIRAFENRQDADEAAVFLDIRSAVLREGNEEGLLGLAFHPNYKENGQFFVYYSTPPRTSIVSRFRVSKESPERADPDSEEKLLQLEQPYANHNGGSIRFGPDGYLYIGLGDGGLANDPHYHGQNLETLLGSILRIGVDRREEGNKYAIPEDNPFVHRPDARGEIWAYGLRNTWRLGFDRKTGDLWTGDVGQDRFEEVNLIRKGGNYGWNVREGFHPFEPNGFAKPSDLIDPVAEYSREDGESVTGGIVYRGSELPGYEGAYFYGDYVSGHVWIVRMDGGRVTENRLVARTGLEIAAFAEDAAGRMYLCAFDGHIYHLRPRDIDVKQVAAAFPKKLSETGMFASVKDNIPAPGLIPYELNMPFWSDFAVKDRYIALPQKQSVRFHQREQWEFPVGTVFVKTFWMHRDRVNLSEPVRLETRLLVHSPQGWFGYTYVYDDDQTEAHLLDGSLLRPIRVKTEEGEIDQPYYFPSRSDCFACHTKAEGFVLGPTTRQMNHTLNYFGETRNQLELLNDLDVFQAPVEQSPDALEAFLPWGFGNLDRSGDPQHVESTLALPEGDPAEHSRAWLEVNCAVCHRPEGIAPRGRDMRYHTPLEKMGLVGERPKHGQLTPRGSLLIDPGDPHISELFFRAAHRGFRQMPPLATNRIDPRGLHVLREWIERLESSE